MKLERMLSIITYLLNHDNVKAKELADKFEVSVRTIYRDIETINLAGIPIITRQGLGGGIGIMPEYKLDKSVLTEDELSSIVVGLKGLYSISEDSKIKFLIEKLSNIARKGSYVDTGSEVMIDLSSWNKEDILSSMIEMLKSAIREKKIITFTYYSNDQLIQRRVEPYKVIYKEANWYLYAYCTLRKDFRLFKIRRMRELYQTEQTFKPKDISMDRIHWDIRSDDKELLTIELAFNPPLQDKLYDFFGTDNYEILEDKRIKVTFQMNLCPWLYGFLLSFGNQVEIIEPPELRDIIKKMAIDISKLYQ